MIFRKPQGKLAQVTVCKENAVLLYVFWINPCHHFIKPAKVMIHGKAGPFVCKDILSINELNKFIDVMRMQFYGITTPLSIKPGDND